MIRLQNRPRLFGSAERRIAARITAYGLVVRERTKQNERLSRIARSRRSARRYFEACTCGDARGEKVSRIGAVRLYGAAGQSRLAVPTPTLAVFIVTLLGAPVAVRIETSD